ncbi:MAG: sigma-54-dependent Fis family transcriptional regulator [Deltaproteobacteria bacterium]|nr:MAG: sigma-54-dependent Fis family transcriptional regulator [Deltaproteobacteria bacterium]
MTGRILVVDDEKTILESLRGILEDEGYEVVCAETGEDGLSLIDAGDFDAMLLDVLLPGMDGIEVLRRVRKKAPSLPVVMISGHGTISTAVTAVKEGAFDFLEKPLSLERVLITVRNAIEKMRLVRANISLRENAIEGVVLKTRSPRMDAVLKKVEVAAPSSATVLVTGENGVGKEVIARLIHEKSGRRGSFIAVNCASIPESLIESELFGYERGAFTGAHRDKRGKVELADGGTLFLDEVGDMSLSLQAKLLRFIEEKAFERVGGTRKYRVDVRLVAATNKDLRKEMEEGRFREDLYFRLNVIPIEVPPLRERKEDIPLLVEHFLSHLGGGSRKVISPEAMEALKEYSWPGNVRELRNVIERVALLSSGEEIGLEEIRESLFDSGRREEKPPEEYREALAWFERKFLLEKLRENGMNVSATARKIGLDRSSIYRKLKSLGLDEYVSQGKDNRE